MDALCMLRGSEEAEVEGEGDQEKRGGLIQGLRRSEIRGLPASHFTGRTTDPENELASHPILLRKSRLWDCIPGRLQTLDDNMSGKLGLPSLVFFLFFGGGGVIFFPTVSHGRLKSRGTWRFDTQQTL